MIVNKYNKGGGSYTLPIASDTVLGGVKVGANLEIDANGVLSAEAGGLEFVDYQTIDTDKALEIYANPEKYVLVSEVDFSDPLIRIGRMPYFFISKNSTRVIYESGRIDDVQVEGQDYNDAYCLDIVITAEGEKNIQINVIKNNVSPTKQYIDDLELSVAGALNLKENITNKVTAITSGSTDTQYPSAKAVYDAVEAKEYELPIASSIELGGVKIGNGITIAADGTISAQGGGGTVDTQMSDSSENAVQNKVIKAYVDSIVGDINNELDSI